MLTLSFFIYLFYFIMHQFLHSLSPPSLLLSDACEYLMGLMGIAVHRILASRVATSGAGERGQHPSPGIGRVGSLTD